MDFTAHKISAHYSMEFETPLFNLLSVFGRLLGKVHEKIRLRYDLPLSRLEGMPGPALNEVGIKATLFNDNVTIHWQPGGFQAEANNITTDDDIAKVIDAIELAFTAFFEFCHNEKLEVKPRKTVLRVNAWFRTDTPNVTAQTIRQMINRTIPPALTSFAGSSDSIQFYPNFHIDRTSKGYGVDYLIQESALSDGGVYATLTVTTIDPTKSAIGLMATALRDELTQSLAIVGVSIPLPRRTP